MPRDRVEPPLESFNSDDDLWPFHIDARPAGYVYLVEWPGGVCKVGCTGRPARWRAFVNRGAIVRAIVRCPALKAIALEGAVHDWLAAANARLAFASKEESRPYLGPGGHGWLECYQEPAWMVAEVLRGEVERAYSRDEARVLAF